MESTFGDYLSSGRNVRGLTLRELASSLEMDISTLAKIEKNWRQFPKDKLHILSEIFSVSYRKIVTEFIKTDIFQQYGHFPDYKIIISDALSENGISYSITELINDGESKKLEFKSSLRYCLKNLKAEKHIEHSTLKNVCAFLNSEGGKLLIGVSDQKEILGLEEYDFKTFKEVDKKDSWLKHFDNLISNYFGDNISQYIIISFEQVDFKTIACVDVLPNNEGPIFLKNIEKDSKQEFYIRRNASAVTLTMEQFYKYSKERWQK